MPAQIVREMLNGGLVTKRHATLLSPGELQQADDCVYRSFDPALHGAPGRTEYNSTALGASPIKGLSLLSFDEGDDLLLAYYTTGLHSSVFTDLVETAFTQVQGVGTLQDTGIETMVPVHFGNSYYMLLSRDRPVRVGYLSASQITYTLSGSASYTISGTTMSTANIPRAFARVVLGQSVTGPGITGTAIVTAKATETSITLSGTPANGTYDSGTLAFAAAQIPSARVMGLDPVGRFSSAQVVVQTDGSGTQGWNSQLGNGYYWFLITEMYIPGEIDDFANGFVESGFVTKPISAQIVTYGTQYIEITHGGTTYPYVNVGGSTPLATHWQVYMSDRQADITITPSLTTFKRVGAPTPIPQTSSPAATTARLSDRVVSRGGYNPTAHAAIGSLPQWDSPAGGYKVGAGGSMSSTAGNAANSFGTFGVDTTGGLTVTGITFVIAGQANNDNVADGKSHAQIVIRSGSKVSNRHAEFIVSPNKWEYFTFGGSFDMWGESWVIGDFANGSLFVEIYRMGTANVSRCVVDGMDITIHLTGTSVNRDGVPFRTVTYRSQVGTTVSDTANLPPPTSSTGDIFQGSIVTNIVAEPPSIQWSLPGIAEAWPKPYKMRFNTLRKDRVTYVRTLGQILLVGLRDSIKRVNYLPTESDVDFQNVNIAHEDLATDHGVAGPHAATLFDMPGVGAVLAYASYKGIHITDGVTTRFLNMDLDWTATVDLNNLDSCILRVYPQENWLVLFYAPFGTSHGKNTRALIFPYASDKIKEGGFLPAIGPIKVSARSATDAALGGRTYLLTGHQATGKVYVEDQAYALPSTYTVANAAGTEEAITIVPVAKTRRMYPGGIGRAARENRIYLMTDAHGATSTATSNTTVDSTTVTSTAAFGSVLPGMLVTGTGIPVETIVTAKASSSSITISRAAIAAGTGVTLSFSSGTLALTVGGQDLAEAVSTLETGYQSTEIGGLLVSHLDNSKESLEFTFSKVTLPSAALAALGVGMRIHYFAILMSDAGQETHRA